MFNVYANWDKYSNTKLKTTVYGFNNLTICFEVDFSLISYNLSGNYNKCLRDIKTGMSH